MFHFSKLTKTSAKDIFAIWSGFAKGLSRQTEMCKLLSAERICRYTKGSTFLPELLDRCPPATFLWYLDSHNLGESSRGITVCWLYQLYLKFLVRGSMKRKNYISTEIIARTGPPRPLSLSWTLDSSSCTDLHRDARRQPGPGHHSPVTWKTSQYSTPWCWSSESETAGDKATSEMTSRLDQKERFQGRSWNADARVILMDPSSDKWFLIERKA